MMKKAVKGIAFAGSVGLHSAQAETRSSSQIRQRELFTKSASPDLVEIHLEEPGSRQRKSYSRSPESSPSLSPADSALMKPLDKLVPLNMHVFRKTFETAEKMADNPSIRNAICGSAEFREFELFMLKEREESLSSSEIQQIEGLAPGEESRERQPRPASEERGEYISPGFRNEELVELLKSLFEVPVGWLKTALNWLLPLSSASRQQVEGKPDEDSNFNNVTFLAAFVMMILVIRRLSRKCRS